MLASMIMNYPFTQYKSVVVYSRLLGLYGHANLLATTMP